MKEEKKKLIIKYVGNLANGYKKSIYYIIWNFVS